MKNICLQMNRKVLVTLLLVVSLAFPALAQKITVNGTVVDNTGEPLIGASVMAQGTNVGTATDFDGNFSLSVEPTATLVVSYVGYDTKTVALNGRTEVRVELAETGGVKLNEVVAIGYGTVRKKDATGSVATIKPDEVKAGISTSVQDLLVGQTPGVVVTSDGGDPKGGATIRIRGGSSLNANNNPLIVVDGVPLDGAVSGGNNLAMIAPDNVESMTILKDASATAIYGSRASNGVIIITTKRGRGGKVQVNFSANMYINTARKTWKVMNATQFAQAVTDYYGAGSAAANALNLDENGVPRYNTNWQKEVLRTTVSSDYNLSVGGKVGILPYRVGISFTNNNGILKDSKMNRLTGSINLNPTFFQDHLQVNAAVKGIYIKNSDPNYGAIGGAISYAPTMPVYNTAAMADGSVGKLWNGFSQWTTGDGTQIMDNAAQNPLAMIKDRSNKYNVWRSNGNLQLDYSLHFLPELHLNLNLGYDVQKENGHTITASNSYSAWTNTNALAPKKGAGYDYAWESHYRNLLLDFYANYKKEFESIKSLVDVMAGYSWQQFKNHGSSNNTVYNTMAYNTPTYDAATNTYSLTWDPSTENIIGRRFSENLRSEDGASYWNNKLQLLSFFGRLNYTFMDRYLLTATVRGDASSRFAKSNRWGVFPSVALAWKISEENFMASTRDWLDEWKLRLGWGLTGQQDVGTYLPYVAVYTAASQGSYYPSLIGARDANGNLVYEPTLYPEGYNGNLKWEKTATWNAGFDFSFLRGRFTAALDYYYRKSTDLLARLPVAPGMATTNVLTQNFGSLTNQGVELSLTARPIQTDDLTWTINYNIAYNKNKITKLNSDGTYMEAVSTGGNGAKTIAVHQVGHPAASWYVFEQVYDNAGQPIEGVYKDQNGDGVINDEDKIFYHSPDPKVTMTIGTTIKYKGWDFGTNWRANIGNYNYINVLQGTTYMNNVYSYGLSNLVVADHYFDAATTESSYWVRNASFLRCDNITVGYTWENLLRDRLKLRLYAAVQNPIVITKYKGIDPEVSGGFDSNVYPKPITFSLGVIANF